MWDHLKNMPPILVGQSIFAFLDLISIVRLETALASSEPSQTFRSFLSYYTNANIKVQIPQERTKMWWLQAHELPIAKVIVHLDKIDATFETNMVHEIELVDNDCTINNNALEFLPNSCFIKVVSVYFVRMQDSSLMEELLPRFHNLRELNVSCRPDGWIVSALQALHRATNNNIIIEKICIRSYDIRIGSVIEIAQYCPRLQSLRVTFRITEDSLLALSTYCPLLKEVDTRSIPRISTEQSAVLCAPALSCIHTIATPFVNLEGQISNYTVAVPYMTALQHVNAVSFIDHLLLPLFSEYCLKLESLTIVITSSATPIQLLQLAQNCRNLHSVHLSKDDFYTDEFVLGLAQRCPNLHKLNFEYHEGSNTGITDSSLLALSKHCLQLQELYVSTCILLTEAAVLQFIHNCKHLHILKVPLNWLSEDTVLSLPAVTVSKNRCFLTLTFDID